MALFDSGVPLANVALSDTFNTWRVRTNQINTQAAGLASNNTFTGTLNTFNNAAAFKGPVTAPIVTANSVVGVAGSFTGPVTAPVVTANSFVGGTGSFTGLVTAPTLVANTLTINGTSPFSAVSGSFTGLLTAPTISANSFVGTLTGTASIATTITLVATNSTDATHYPLFVDAATGNENPRTDTGFTYNPSSGTLAATDFNATSDIAYKTNVTPIDNALEIVKQLAGKAFNWKHTGKKSYGVIAQEIEEVLPDVVTTNENGKAVNYNTIIALLIESNKQLSQKIENLELKLK